MNQNNSLLSTRDAAEASGFSLRHIQKLIKGGKLSASMDDGGNYMIDKSEFYRVFPWVKLPIWGKYELPLMRAFKRK